ncbi:nephrin-like isoform X2 [Penaeus chinensis]|uniref:nephrin-like isoform X2 n=1 Tax=Penaeus chinensis TaxID=139456 RepID=UPI001FB588C1|nr:nephrin-like isoform X2 [Penaeus chinensis]
MKTVWVVSGGRAELPCVPRTQYPDDQPVLVLWYRSSKTRPVYSYDARVGDFTAGVRWTDPETLGGRAYFTVISEPPSLVLEPAHPQDEGVYTCRVDYRLSTSTRTNVNLTVVIPPGPPMVMWRGQRVVGAVGPLTEGERVDLTCRSVGGRPQPVLTWWRKGLRLPLLTVNSTTDSVTGTYAVEATLTLTASRAIAGVDFTCHAYTPTELHGDDGSAIVQPRTATISLNVTLPPMEVRILSSEHPIAAGRSIRLVCRSVGSHPPAHLSWWSGTSPLRQVVRAIEDAGNVTTATLNILVERQHDGTTLRCTGINPALPHSPLTDTYKLTVHYAPVVGLRLGRALTPRLIKEGDDVYFECDVQANPPFHRVDWFHNGMTMEHNMSAGVIMSGLSLIIRDVTRQHAGSYTCEAANMEARTISNAVYLTVKHAPVCAGTGLERTQGAARGSATAVKCTVEAEPARGISWTWVRTLADGSEVDLPEESISSEGVSSSVSVTPQTPEDYGQLLCRASNEVGQQRQACVVTLVPAGPPDTPSNCTAAPVNPEASTDSASLAVSCLEGFDGGLPQSFLLETWQEGVLIANMSSDFPEWVVTELRAGVGATLQVTAYNARGASGTLLMEVLTTSAQHHAAPDAKGMPDIPPLLGAALGGVGVLLLLLLVGVVVAKRVHRRPKKPVVEMALTPTAGDDYDPDVVKSIPRRPHSLDVLPHAREDEAHEMDLRSQDEDDEDALDAATHAFVHSRPGSCSSSDSQSVASPHHLDESHLYEADRQLSPGRCSCAHRHSHTPTPDEEPRDSHHRSRDRQDLRLTDSQSDDSGLSESESDPELRELMPAGEVAAAERQAGDGRAYEALPSEDAPSPQYHRHPHSRSSSCGARRLPSSVSAEFRKLPVSPGHLRESPRGSRVLPTSPEDLRRRVSPPSGESRGSMSSGGELRSPSDSLFACSQVTPPTEPACRCAAQSVPPKRTTRRKLPTSPPQIVRPSKKAPYHVPSHDVPRHDQDVRRDSEPYGAGRPATLVEGDTGEIILLTRQSPRADDPKSGRPFAPVFPTAKVSDSSRRLQTLPLPRRGSPAKEHAPRKYEATPVSPASPKIPHLDASDYQVQANPDVCKRETSV